MKKLICIMAGVFLLAGCSGAMSPDGDAGESQTVNLGDTVTLDGTKSDEKNGEDLEYTWTIVSAPTGSQAILSDPRAAQPTFTPDMVGTYTFELVVDNDYHKSEPVQVTVKCLAAGEIPPTMFTSDDSGEIVGYDLEAIDVVRDTTSGSVSFRLRCTLENTSAERVEISFTVFGVDAAGVDVFEEDITAVLNAGMEVTSNFPTSATIEIYDSITAWEADPITITVPE